MPRKKGATTRSRRTKHVRAFRNSRNYVAIDERKTGAIAMYGMFFCSVCNCRIQQSQFSQKSSDGRGSAFLRQDLVGGDYVFFDFTLGIRVYSSDFEHVSNIFTSLVNSPPSCQGACQVPIIIVNNFRRHLETILFHCAIFFDKKLVATSRNSDGT